MEEGGGVLLRMRYGQPDTGRSAEQTRAEFVAGLLDPRVRLQLVDSS